METITTVRPTPFIDPSLMTVIQQPQKQVVEQVFPVDPGGTLYVQGDYNDGDYIGVINSITQIEYHTLLPYFTHLKEVQGSYSDLEDNEDFGESYSATVIKGYKLFSSKFIPKGEESEWIHTITDVRLFTGQGHKLI